jgi:hypothetical protein
MKLKKIFRKKHLGLPSRAATCEPEHVYELRSMFTSTRGTISMPPLNRQVCLKACFVFLYRVRNDLFRGNRATATRSTAVRQAVKKQSYNRLYTVGIE